MINRLMHSSVYVFDQDEARDFYVDKLGFEVRADITTEEGFRWLTVSPTTQADMEIVLMQLVEGPSFNAEQVEHLRGLIRSGAIGGGVFHTDDCRATYAELLQKGVEFMYPPREEFYGVETVFRDPFGTWFSLVEPAPMG